jgi:hypothetical protein
MEEITSIMMALHCSPEYQCLWTIFSKIWSSDLGFDPIWSSIKSDLDFLDSRGEHSYKVSWKPYEKYNI